MRINVVLIDYENVQPDAMAIIHGEHFKVMVFVGSNQSKVSFEVASSLQKMGDRAEYIKINGNGPNALDFHIAYYIGLIAAKTPDAYFHIISKDSGFDPLVAHLKTQKIFACRSPSINEIPSVKAENANTSGDKIDVIVVDLKRRGTSRPRAVKTLTSTINSIFQKKLPAQEVELLVEGLKKKGLIKINGEKVSYSLPA
ncbi:MAG: PIN domain-containing protein [Gammaproteobacteria bacterium]|tara:strand:+ start:3835 stop:4431 length:597 start_codon:yes stop_codon:yes gene_type:complete